jgi:aerotaxis receptor
MRTNLPISNGEFTFPAEQTLVSVTDLKGRIVYCNPAFITVSGFGRDELLGQPHNIVRHPDMPAEAFRDMWDTIQSGMPWTGLVKNRRKDGAFYWVRANATPMTDGGHITGFLSVRSVPTRQEIEAVTALYRRMKTEEQAASPGLGLRRGKVVRHDLVGRLLAAMTPGERGAQFALQGLAAGLVGGTAALAPWPVAAFIGLTVALTTALLSRRMTQGPLASVLHDARCLSSGDLTHRVATGAAGITGELQQSLNQLAQNMRTVVADVRTEIEQVRAAVKEIADGNQDLASRTESQAASLEQTAASMEQINGTVQQSAASAKQGAQLAAEMAALAEGSQAAVQASALTMEQIAESSSRMSDIISTIEGVAFQTNILALNAAVEAARAGESGRGFAVVATEVRALAHRTTDAAKEIKTLIQSSGARVSAGSEQSRQAREKMVEAVESVRGVGGVLGQISITARDQTVGISQINEAVTHLDSVTQQNAAMVEEIAAASHRLTGQVDEVLSSLRLFRLHAGEAGAASLDAVELRRRAKA